MLNAVVGLGTSIINRVPEFGAKRAGVVLSFYFIEKYLTAPKVFKKKNAPPKSSIKPYLNGFSKGVQIIACLGATRIFKSNWISVPTSAAILISSVALPLVEKYKAKFGEVKLHPQAPQDLKRKALYYGIYCGIMAAKGIIKYEGVAKTVFNGLQRTTSWINTFAIALLAKSYLPQLVDQAQRGLSKMGIDVNLSSPREIIQKTPEIGKIRGAVEVLSLMVESYNWMDKNQTDEKVISTSLSKIIQIAACLGMLPQLASYKAYIPAVIGATLVAGYTSSIEKDSSNKNSMNILRAIAHPLNLFVKTVNSIAVGVLINNFFKNPSQNKLIVGTAAMFALSSYNMYKDWYKDWNKS